jgi:hypothetical protein
MADLSVTQSKVRDRRACSAFDRPTRSATRRDATDRALDRTPNDEPSAHPRRAMPLPLTRLPHPHCLMLATGPSRPTLRNSPHACRHDHDRLSFAGPMSTGATDLEITTDTFDMPLARALHGVTLRTVHRALQTKNPDALIAGALKLHDLIHYLLDHHAIASYREKVLEHFRRHLEKIYHVHSPEHRGYNPFYYPPESETPEREPGFQKALQLLEVALQQYHLACEEVAPEPESP